MRGTNGGTATAAKAVAEDLSTLVRAELDLAKAELATSARGKAIGGGMFTAAAISAWLALQALLVAAGFALALVLPGWAAALIVGGAMLLFALILAALGKRKLATPVRLDTTKASIEEDIAWTKAHLPTR